MNVDTKN